MSTIGTLRSNDLSATVLPPEIPTPPPDSTPQDTVQLLGQAHQDLAAHGSNLNDLAPREQRALLQQLRMQSAASEHRLTQQYSTAQGATNDMNQRREATLRDQDGQAAGVRKGAAVLSFGASENAIGARHDAETGNLKGAAVNTLMAAGKVVLAAGIIGRVGGVVTPVARAGQAGTAAVGALSTEAPAVAAGEVATAEATTSAATYTAAEKAMMWGAGGSVAVGTLYSAVRDKHMSEEP